MKVLSLVVASGLFGLGASQCSPSLGELVVPAIVAPGQPFQVVVRGTSPPASYHTNTPVACVVQVPVGVAVLGATNRWNVAMALDTVVGACVPESGHYLKSFVGQVSLPVDGALVLTLQAGPTAPASGSVKVVLGLDNGTFVPTSPAGITDFALVGGTHARAFVVAGAPVFAADAGAPLAGGSAAVVMDVDGDGHDDVVAAAVGGSQLHARLARPGAVPLTVATPVQPGGSALAAGDFDGDGRADAVVGGNVRFGDGTGAFPVAVALPGAATAAFASVGDVDGDRRVDVLHGDAASLRLALSLGDRTFADASAGLPALPAGLEYGSLPWHVVDVTGDGHADLVGALRNPAVPTESLLHVWVGNGAGTWTRGAATALAGATDLQVGDCDGNGTAEVLAAGGAGVAGALFRRFMVAANGDLVAAGLGPWLERQARSVRGFDHDRDGVLDLVAVQEDTAGTVRLLRGLGGGAFEEWAHHGLPTGVAAGNLLVGDWNGDTFPDLAGDAAAWQNQGVGVRAYGAGCTALGIAPSLGAVGEPTLGNLGFALELAVPAYGATFVWVGFSKRNGLSLPSLPFDLAPFGAPGCAVLAEPRALSFVLADAAGIARLPLGIPLVPALHHVPLFAQGAALVPAANAFGALLSPGLVVRID